MRELLEHFKPANLVDICEESGTSRDVAAMLGVPYHGLDLHSGFDYTSMSVLKAVGHHSSMVFSHPSYHSVVVYSGNQWGEACSADHSRCESVDEFLAKSEVMLLNQRDATLPGGHYVTLIGDQRGKGVGFQSYQADFIKMMPREELISVTIKLQHNCFSDRKQYNGSYVPIQHEYLICWTKKSRTLFQIQLDKAIAHKNSIAATWRAAIRVALMRLEGTAPLQAIYVEVEKVAGNLVQNNKHYKAKIRQVLQKHFTSVERGVWAA